MSPWALLALAVLAPLCLVHLRHPPRREVASTLLWRELGLPSRSRPRRIARPALPLLFLLQALSVALAAGALAEPAARAPAAAPARTQVLVLDAGQAMTATDIAPDRFAVARRTAAGLIQHAPDGTRITVIAAAPRPRVLGAGGRDHALHAVAALAPSRSPADLATALRLAAWESAAAPGPVTVTVIRARGDALPPVTDPGHELTVITIGRGDDDQAITRPVARCAPMPRCVVFAQVDNDAGGAVTDRIEVLAGGRDVAGRELSLPARSATPVSLALPAAPAVPPAVELRLTRPDIIAADNVAQVALPLPRRAGVTIVGTGAAMGVLARAFGAMPGVTVRTLAPSAYLTAGARGGGLVVLDRWLPGGRIPAAAGVLLVDPPDLPGGSAAGQLTDPVLAGTDDGSPLLAGADLTALSVPASATERIVPPAWLAPVAWARGGPLLAAGVSGARRVAVLAFDPAATNLPALGAFPILLRNILRWAEGTAPAAVQAGPDVQAAGVRFAPHPGAPAVPVPPRPWWRWAVAGALLAFAAEAGYALGLPGAITALAAGTPRRRRGQAPRRPRGRTPRGRGALAARLAAIALLGGALAGPGLTRPGGGAPLLLIDRSGSLAGPSAASEDAWVRAVRGALPQARVVTFGTGTGTDIAQAIRLAAAVITGSPASRLVLASDGLATSGDAVAAALAAKTPVDVADMAPAAPGPGAAVTRVAAPRAVRAGDTIPLQVTVHATVARPAAVTVWRDGHAAGRLAVRLAAGDNPLLISSPSGPPGWRRFRVTVAMSGDRVRANDALDAVTHVAGVPRLLYVGNGDPFTGALRRLGFIVDAREPSGVPATAAGFGAFDGVILNDIPDGRLVPAQLTALATAVRTTGLGLLVLGGTHSLTAGWYAGTPLTAALPVAGTGAGPQGSAALELVLDRSGSMNDLAGDVTKISMARAAALGAIAFARDHHDRLGIISFDTAPHLLVPMRVMTAANAAAAGRAVAGLTANGGTDIYAALRAAAGQVTRMSGHAAARQLVLMTDGVSQSASYDVLVRGLRAAGVSLTSVGLGGQVDRALLQHLAATGGGRYYYTNDAADLPRIFADEERRSVRPAHVTGRIPAVVSASVPAVRSLVGARVPDAGGLDATRLKPLATGDIMTGDVATGRAASGGERHPLLAQWQYGLGRVAVWTPGMTPAWAAGWAAEAGLWNDTVRWLLPGVPVPVLTPRLADAYPGGAATAEVDTVGNAGVLLPPSSLRASVAPPRGPAAPIVLGPAGAGLFTATLPDAGPGVYRITVWPPGPAGTAATVTELAVGYPREYLPSPDGSALLAQVAAATGGRVLTGPASAAAWESAHNGTHRLSLWWLLAMLALAAFGAGVLLRPPPPGRRTARPPGASPAPAPSRSAGPAVLSAGPPASLR